MKLTGAHPSTPDPRDLDYAFDRSELVAGAMLPERVSVDVTGLHTWRIQGAQSCVSYTTWQQVQDLATAQGRPLPRLSAAWGYGGARLLSGAPIPGVGLPDAGSNYRQNLKWARDRGGVAEQHYPDIPANVPRVPPAHVWQSGGVVRVGACRRIQGEHDPAALRTGIVTALLLARDGKCSMPGSVMPVDDAYGALPEGEVYAAQGGKPWGNHAQGISAIDHARDAVAMLSTWERRVYWVSIEWLARFGGEFWVIEEISRA